MHSLRHQREIRETRNFSLRLTEAPSSDEGSKELVTQARLEKFQARGKGETRLRDSESGPLPRLTIIIASNGIAITGGRYSSSIT